MTPEWKAFIAENNLLKRETVIPADRDKTGLGAVILWMSEASSTEEKEKFYPGIAVAPLGYIPVGECQYGSGDPYFISERGRPYGPLYRVYHDSVGEGGVGKDAIVLVLEDYREILKYTE
jgi:hypothetical protein